MVNFKIEAKPGFNTTIFIDDIEIKGVSSYRLSHDAGGVPILSLEFPTKGVTVNGKGVFEIPEETKAFLLKQICKEEKL